MPLAKYLEQLRAYASMVRVPGLEVASEPIPLSEIFVEPHAHNETESLGSKMFGSLPLNRVLFSHHHTVILGEPGQGKTTMLRQYGVELAKDASPECLPILVELGRKRTWNQPAGLGWLYERMPDVLRQSLDSDGWDILDGIVKNGKGTILLDGLDEVSPESQRGRLEFFDQLFLSDLSAEVTAFRQLVGSYH